jgi:amidohydrolase
MNQNIKDYIIKIRRQIHEYPEIGFEEYRTQKLITSELKKMGVKFSVTKQKTGVIAIIPGKSKNNVIGFRADMDALPIEEDSNKIYKSKIKNRMHACGHDSHVAMLLGLAKFLSSSKNKLLSTIKFIFQPNEEGSYGAKHMIKEGCLKNPKLNSIYGIHVAPSLKSGQIGLRYGVMMAGVDKFRIKLTSSGGHAALPHKTSDIIVAGSAIILGIQTIVSRNISPLDSGVISIGKISAGDAFNVLPNELEFTGTIRSLSEKVQKNIHYRLKNLIHNYCKAYDVKYELEIETLGGPLENNNEIVDQVKNIAINLVGKNNVIILDEPSMGGEDFADYLKYVPGCFIYLGTKNESKNIIYGWHNPKFDIDENVLSLGTELLEHIARV